jgi:hypothetical protein
MESTNCTIIQISISISSRISNSKIYTALLLYNAAAVAAAVGCDICLGITHCCYSKQQAFSGFVAVIGGRYLVEHEAFFFIIIIFINNYSIIECEPPFPLAAATTTIIIIICHTEGSLRKRSPQQRTTLVHVPTPVTRHQNS